MFPITELIEILNIVKGQQPFTWKRALKITSKLTDFAADQIPDGATPIKWVQPLKVETVPAGAVGELQCQLQEIVDAHEDPKKQAALNVDWMSLILKVFAFFASMAGGSGHSYNQGGAGPG